LEKKARSPEKAGVGGSIPSLATIHFKSNHQVGCSGERKRGLGHPSKAARAKPFGKKSPQP